MTEHNGRFVIDKVVQKLRLKDGAENLISELDRIDQHFNEVHLSAVLSDVATLFPDVYSSVAEAPAYVVHIENRIKDGKIKPKEKKNG